MHNPRCRCIGRVGLRGDEGSARAADMAAAGGQIEWTDFCPNWGKSQVEGASPRDSVRPQRGKTLMGSARRPRPARLAEKLLQIRLALNLTRSQMFRHLSALPPTVYARHLSEYESGKREPPLSVLLAYAWAAGVPVELLINDSYDVPARLPADNIEWDLKRGRVWRRKSS